MREDSTGPWVRQNWLGKKCWQAFGCLKALRSRMEGLLDFQLFSMFSEFIIKLYPHHTACSIFPLGCNFSATLISPPQIVNSSLISNQAKTAIMQALWDEKLRNEDHFNETAFVMSWFQKRLRPFLSGISPEMLQCLHNESMQCEQYQAMYVVGLLIFSSVMTVQLSPGLHNTC